VGASHLWITQSNSSGYRYPNHLPTNQIVASLNIALAQLPPRRLQKLCSSSQNRSPQQNGHLQIPCIVTDLFVLNGWQTQEVFITSYTVAILKVYLHQIEWGGAKLCSLKTFRHLELTGLSRTVGQLC
jgi:hypothetical protein